MRLTCSTGAVGGALLLSLVGCSTGSEAPPSGGRFVIPEGKADDFLSLSAQEFIVSGRATVVLEDEFRDAESASRLERVRELVGLKQIAIAWFLNQYLIDKKSDASNADYGGYRAMARANTYEDMELREEEDGVFSFYFEQLVAGDPQLMSRLPTSPGEGGAREFTLVIGSLSNEELAQLETNSEWYRRAPWSAFNPEELDESRKEELIVGIRPEVESDDAWFDYVSMIEDGVLDIDVHFGWDYHAAYHIQHARALFGWLVRQGFDAPVGSFQELDRNSGPFTRTLDADGREIAIEVRIYYGHPGGETDPDTDAGGRVLEDDLRGSLRARDVIMYSGHSGPFYGFAMGNWRQTEEGDLDDSEMKTVAMPEERYQLVVAEGCDTYQIGEAFRQNPAKPDGAFIDIITTTAPSDASSPATVQEIIAHLLETDSAGRHDPMPIRALLRELDDNSFWFHTMYGVHGIDDNPQVHPYSDAGGLCGECIIDEDCGGPGNLCVRLAGSASYCTASCTTDAGCGDDACVPIASEGRSAIDAYICLPAEGC